MPSGLASVGLLSFRKISLISNLPRMNESTKFSNIKEVGRGADYGYLRRIQNDMNISENVIRCESVAREEVNVFVNNSQVNVFPLWMQRDRMVCFIKRNIKS